MKCPNNLQLLKVSPAPTPFTSQISLFKGCEVAHCKARSEQPGVVTNSRCTSGVSAYQVVSMDAVLQKVT